MKKLFKIIFGILLLFSFFTSTYAWIFEVKIWWWNSQSSQKLKNDILDWITDKSVLWTNTEITSFFSILKENILSLVYIIVIWTLVWIWIRMASSRWNPEEFKKAWIHFVYVLVWVFIIFAAVWIVKIISWINIF